jgi:hypothetical protein
VASAQAAAVSANETSSKEKAKRIRRDMRSLHGQVRAGVRNAPNMSVAALQV